MQTIGETQNISSTPEEQIKNKTDKPLRGFNTHPENINRNGAPKKEWTFKKILQDALEEVKSVTNRNGEEVKIEVKRIVIDKLIKKAISEEDMQAIKEIIDRMDGKPMQQIDHTTQGDKIPGPTIYIPSEDK